MKAFFTLLAAIAISISARADQTDGKQTPSKPIAKAEAPKVAQKDREKVEKVLWTGSLIPQRIHKNGLITDGSSPLVVIDQAAIDRSGASTVSGVLRHYR